METFIHLIIQMLQIQWVSWMKYAKEVVITPETSYSDIIVPTVDTVRMSFLTDLLLSNKKPVRSSHFYVENLIQYTVNLMPCKCAAKLVSFSDLSGVVHWAHWHRKDPDHIRQAPQKHAC